MPRKSQPSAWVLAQAEARKVKEDAFDAARKANPELYRSLKNAVDDSSDAYKAIDKKYRSLAEARSHANSLCYSFRECGLDAEATVAMGLLAIVDKLLQPLLEPHKIAGDNCDLAQSAFDKEFKFSD